MHIGTPKGYSGVAGAELFTIMAAKALNGQGVWEGVRAAKRERAERIQCSCVLRGMEEGEMRRGSWAVWLCEVVIGERRSRSGSFWVDLGGSIGVMEAARVL